MSSERKIFLGRNQKIFGPLSAVEIEALERSGQLLTYSWILREGETAWSPIDPPPGLPTSTTSDTHREAPALRLVRPKAEIPVNRFHIILFDHRNAISGTLAHANDSGCEIVSDHNGADPLFVLKEAAFISLHDTESGETIKLRARISSVRRRPDGRGWSYRAQWDAAPSLFERFNREERPEVAA